MYRGFGMEMSGKESDDKILAADTIQKLDRALGQAVVEWSDTGDLAQSV